MRTFFKALAALIFSGSSALAADAVSVGTIGNSSDAAFYIAQGKGYWKAEGLDVTFVPFDTSARMIAPLGRGDLDVGAGTANAALYNAAGRDIAIKIVADRSRTEPGSRFQVLTIRKELVDSGAVKSLADLKGKKIALVTTGGSQDATLNEAAKKGGIKWEDIEKVYLAFPQQIAAFSNGAIDGSIMVEPFGSNAEKAGVAKIFLPTEDFITNDQIGMVFFSEKFAKDRKDVGVRFMRGYIRALRDYNDAIDKEGRFSRGPKGQELVKLIASQLNMKPEVIADAFTQAIDPNGRVNEASMRRALDFFKYEGLISASNVAVEQILDNSFVESALKDLGPYTPAKE